MKIKCHCIIRLILDANKSKKKGFEEEGNREEEKGGGEEGGRKGGEGIGEEGEEERGTQQYSYYSYYYPSASSYYYNVYPYCYRATFYSTEALARHILEYHRYCFCGYRFDIDEPLSILQHAYSSIRLGIMPLSHTLLYRLMLVKSHKKYKLPPRTRLLQNLLFYAELDDMNSNSNNSNSNNSKRFYI